MSRCITCKYSNCIHNCDICDNKVGSFGCICRCVKEKLDKDNVCKYYKEKEVTKNVDIQ